MTEPVPQAVPYSIDKPRLKKPGQSALPKLHRMVSRSLVLSTSPVSPHRYALRAVSHIDTHQVGNKKSQSQMSIEETLRIKEEQLLVKLVRKELPKKYKKAMNKKIKWLRGELPFLGSRENMLRPEQLYERKLENIRMAEKILMAKPTPELTRCQTELFYQDQQNVVKLRRMGGGCTGARAKTQPKKG